MQHCSFCPTAKKGLVVLTFSKRLPWQSRELLPQNTFRFLITWHSIIFPYICTGRLSPPVSYVRKSQLFVSLNVIIVIAFLVICVSVASITRFLPCSDSTLICIRKWIKQLPLQIPVQQLRFSQAKYS